jgi:hypothetical protein
VINSKRSGLGWRGGRIAVLVSLACVGGVLLGSAGTASASSVSCSAELDPVNPKKPGVDANLELTCNEAVRGFSVITNKTFDFFGTEVDVFLPSGEASSQAAILQCEGNVPGPGIGCGVPNRQVGPSSSVNTCEVITQTGSGSGGSIPPPGPQPIQPKCAQQVDAGSRMEQKLGFPVNPCKRVGQFAPGKDKLKIWVSVLTEPLIGAFNAAYTAQDQTTYTRGTYISQPFPAKIAKYNKCTPPKPGKGKGKGKAKGKKASNAFFSALEFIARPF